MINNSYRVHKYILEKPKVLRMIKQKENSKKYAQFQHHRVIPQQSWLKYARPSSNTQGDAAAVMLKHSTPGLPLQRYHDRILPMVSPSLDDSLLTIYGYILQLRLVNAKNLYRMTHFHHKTLLGVVSLPYKK